jgi:hypothetical protein
MQAPRNRKMRGMAWQCVIGGWAVKLFENEKEIFEILSAYVQEWGVHHVRVVVPEQWTQYAVTKVGQVQLVFSADQAVTITGGTRSSYASFRVPLNIEAPQPELASTI